jgi:uncharacterized protein YceH (UPF0502 family)
VDLTTAEIRVLGCLLEKQRTTPEAYPLSLNALRLACNQTTNREPVVDYDEATIRDALHRLSRRRWARLASGPGSRAPKYRHLLDEALGLPEDELAVLCVLMLRGPQTPGELKQRSERLHALPDLAGVHATLERLIERELAARLERRPGQKEERYAQLLGEEEQPGAATAPGAVAAAGGGRPPPGGGGPPPPPPAAPPPPVFAAPDPPETAPDSRVDEPAAGVAAPDPRIDDLAAGVAALRAEVAELRAILDSLRADLGA